MFEPWRSKTSVEPAEGIPNEAPTDCWEKLINTCDVSHNHWSRNNGCNRSWWWRKHKWFQWWVNFYNAKQWKHAACEETKFILWYTFKNRWLLKVCVSDVLLPFGSQHRSYLFMHSTHLSWSRVGGETLAKDDGWGSSNSNWEVCQDGRDDGPTLLVSPDAVQTHMQTCQEDNLNTCVPCTHPFLFIEIIKVHPVREASYPFKKSSIMIWHWKCVVKTRICQVLASQLSTD